MDTNTSSPQDERTGHATTAGSSRKLTVLYIEDNSTNRQLVRYIIDMHQDLTMLEAEDGARGMELVKKSKPDLILLDIHLPDMDGFTIFRHLQSDPETAHIPIVALSGSSAPADIQRAMTTGFKKFLSKPLNIQEFNSTLKAILGK